MNKLIVPFLTSLFLLCGCTHRPSLPENYTSESSLPIITPDYIQVTIPPNIAPLNFMVSEAEECVAEFTWPGGKQTFGEKNKVVIPEKEWKQMMEAAKGDSIRIVVYSKSEEKWTRHKAFAMYVAEEETDPYISYRLISPSYIGYEGLTINQRHVSSFEEKVVYSNELVQTEEEGQCINCHAYQNYRTDNMQFHMRQAHGGTMIVKDGTPQKINLNSKEIISAGVYPAWHPTHKLIAYSTNLTGQSFHTKLADKIEVQDTESDLILYDVAKNEVSLISAEANELETYPWWSPDGRTLYYASARMIFSDTIPRDYEAALRYEEFKYDLYSRSFDPDTRTFGPSQLVYSASEQGKSATLPRISPDGQYLLFTMGKWGCFHIWHPDADLYLTDLKNGETRLLENINSPQAESYHSWSSNGRWILLSSRRDDGNFTRLYFAYFDKQGKAHKAFELPQKDPEFYLRFLRSYNIPEFMLEPVEITPHEFAAAAKKKGVPAKFVSTSKASAR